MWINPSDSATLSSRMRINPLGFSLRNLLSSLEVLLFFRHFMHNNITLDQSAGLTRSELT